MHTPSALARLPRDTRDTLFVLLVIGWVILPQIGNVPIWVSALAAAVLAVRGWLAVSSRPLPGRRMVLLLLTVTLVATWATHRTLLGRDAGVTLVVMLLTLKTLELRARRDALVVFFLGFFVMLTNFFYSQSLATAAAMLLALLGLLTALVNAHRPVGRPSLRESAWTAAKLSLAGVPVMVALFVFFPRFAPLWGIPTDAMLGRSGLSSSMEVGAVAKLALDDGIALRVRFDGQPPPQSQLYFRGPVLTRFDGRRWTAADGDARFGATPAPGPGDLQVSGAPIGYAITLEPSQRPWLLTLDVAPRHPELPDGWRVRMTADLQWIALRPVTDLLRYRAESYPLFRYGLTGWDGRPRRDIGNMLRLPQGFNSRTLALAEELRRQVGDGDTAALVRAALERLRSGGYTYTLEPGVYGRDTADQFWFDTKAGFCEHIASAFVVLMRAAGVPARVVTGFQGGELNSVDGYWTVRNADAHAWAEVWQADLGWVRIDPTGAVSPGRVGQFQRLRLPEGALAGAVGYLSPTLLAQLRATWEAINNGWNQWVLNYTQSRQFDMLRNLGFDSPSWQDLGMVLAGLLVAAALAGMLWAYWERSRSDPWLRLLVRARRHLAAAGVAAAPQAPPRELLQCVQASALPAELKRPLVDWLLALERLRYAPRATSNTATLATLQRRFRQFSWPRA
jgi:transglutaminase-like putative cysteine protease